MVSNKILPLAGVMLVFAAAQMAAKTIYVSPTGNDSRDGRSPSAALATFGKAIAQAADGDKILFTGTMRPADELLIDGLKNLTIEGTGDDRSANIIDGGNYSRLVHLTGSADVTLRNLTLRGGKAAQRGGAIMAEGSRLTLDHCDLYNNRTALDANAQGGAVYQSGGQLVMTDVTFYGNRSYQGGALYANEAVVNGYGVSFEQNQTWLDDESVSRPSEARGGAAVIVNCQTTLDYCTFAQNSAKGDGGALWLLTRKEGCALSMNGCALTGNHAGDPTSAIGGMHGGAIIYGCYAPLDAYIRSTTIALNETPSAGGALFYTGDAAGAKLNFVNCTITKNRTQSNAGNCGGLNITDRQQAEVTLLNSIVEGNLCADNQTADVAFGTSAHIRQLHSAVGTGATNDNMVPQMDCESRCFPLLPDGAWTTTADLTLAQSYGCTTDQFGQPWTQPYIGAVQLLDSGDIPLVPTGAKIAKVDADGPPIDNVYTLQGLPTKKSAKGIYIHNGKKIVVK